MKTSQPIFSGVKDSVSDEIAHRETRSEEHGSGCYAVQPCESIFLSPLDRMVSEEPAVANAIRDVTEREGYPTHPEQGAMRVPTSIDGGALPMQVIVEAMSDPVFATDAEWNVLYMNPGAERLTQTSRLSPKPSLWDLLPASECASNRSLKDLLQSQQSWTDSASPDCLLNVGSPRTSIVTLRISDFSGTDEFESGHVVVLQDVPDQRQPSRPNLEPNKMEAIGQLASGIAHEINTPLQYVGDNIQFLAQSFASMEVVVTKYRQAIAAMADASGHPQVTEAMDIAEQDADLKYIEECAPKAIEQAAEGVSRISAIVSAMKEFAHPDGREKQPADLNRALLATLTIARNEYKYVADVVTELGELSPVSCHIGDMSQVFLNLIVNAAHAISDVPNRPAGKGRIQVRTAQENGQVRIEIADTGCGILAAIRERIFDPFFTTKEVGRGSGQGLAIARSIVMDKHGGSLEFESEVGKGTTFIIILPIVETAPAHR